MRASNTEPSRREGGRRELSGLSDTRNKMDWEGRGRRRRKVEERK